MVSLTLNTWTSIQNMNYMCVIAHYIDERWGLNKKILKFCLISNHKGETIGITIDNCLKEWGISKFCVSSYFTETLEIFQEPLVFSFFFIFDQSSSVALPKHAFSVLVGPNHAARTKLSRAVLYTLTSSDLAYLVRFRVWKMLQS